MMKICRFSQAEFLIPQRNKTAATKTSVSTGYETSTMQGNDHMLWIWEHSKILPRNAMLNHQNPLDTRKRKSCKG